MFRHYRENALQEKIYMHTDRSFYLTGETLWFKIYAVDGSHHQPLDISRVAYAEILDRHDFPVLQAKIELENGLGSGSFFLPASLTSGNYTIRVYTSWMKNFKPDFYFHQNISIVNPFIIPEEIKNTTPPIYSVAFFPEGGNLISGIESKVAFKVTGDTGQGTDAKGFVMNANGDTIASFIPTNFGLGHFTITPSHQEQYKAILEQPSGEYKTFAFPEVHPTGYAMQVLDSGEFVNVTITSNVVKAQNVYLFVHARQIMVHAEGQTLSRNKAHFVLRKSDLPGGIAHLTLFDNHLQPSCERLYFTYPRKSLEIGITANQKIFTPRKKVTVSLHTTQKGPGNATPANLSLSVYKLDSLSTPNPMSIYQYLWLGSDLTGSIESPAYYFVNEGKEVKESMDNLMLTHGWRKFSWNEVLNDSITFQFLPEVREHIVTGVITKDQKKQRGIFTYLGSPGKIIRAYGSWSNERGEVRFEIKDFYGPRRIILQTRTDSSETYAINIQNPFSRELRKERLPVFSLPEQSKDELLARSIAMQVQDIFYYEQYGNRIIPPSVDSTAFYGKADATYFLDDYTRFPVMEEVMREYVPGVFVRKRKDGFYFIVVDYVKGGVLSGDPMVLLDGVPILDVDDIMRMDPLRVKKLEVVKRPYHLGQAVFPGIISYTTYQGDLGGMQIDSRSVSLNYDGLQLKREFFSPQYTREQVNDRMPDQRLLLHWEPEITTDDKGNHQLEFYTSDVPGQYAIVVEGLNDKGYSGSNIYTFTVTPADNQ